MAELKTKVDKYKDIHFPKEKPFKDKPEAKKPVPEIPIEIPKFNPNLFKIPKEKPKPIVRALPPEHDPKYRNTIFGSDVYYGDISSPHTLEMAGVANAEVIVCCIDDMLLKGTSNLKLYEACKHINNDVKFIGTANDLKTEMNLLDSGVFAVLNPSNESAPALFNKINKAL